MNIYVDGKKAVLKNGFSFEYVAENRLFRGRDGYTLSIVFPLSDCPQNIDIFGHINRADVDVRRVSFECAIVDANVSLFGTITVVKLSEVEVECQFAEGRCSRTMATTIDETYIDELDLGRQPSYRANECSVPSALGGLNQGRIEVAIPWVNEDYPEADNNWIDVDAEGKRTWHCTGTRLSWQPYLMVIAKRICQKIGYTPDFHEWEGSSARYLIVCNTLPPSWEMPQYSRVMPHWTVGEFFDKLELLLGCEFDFDVKAKTVSMRSTDSVLDSIDVVRLDSVVDSYSGEISSDDDTSCDYIGSKVLKYAGDSSKMWSFYACDDFVADCPLPVVPYVNVDAVLNHNKRRPDESGEKDVVGEQVEFNMGTDREPEIVHKQTPDCVLYAEAENRYFIMRSVGIEAVKGGNLQKYLLQPLNVFGTGVAGDDYDEESLDFVPVTVAETYVDADNDRGPMMFLRPGNLDNTSETDDDQKVVAGTRFPNANTGTYKTWPEAAVESFDADANKSFYDKIYVGYWDGTVYDPDGYVYPTTDSLGISQSWKKFYAPFTLNLRNGSGRMSDQVPKIDSRRKFKFSWLATEIPNPRAVFFIHGKRYLCEKITATFTENGKSQLLRGEFYPLADD